MTHSRLWSLRYWCSQSHSWRVMSLRGGRQRLILRQRYGMNEFNLIAHWISVEPSWTERIASNTSRFQSWIDSPASCNWRTRYWISRILFWISSEQLCKRPIQYWIQPIMDWIWAQPDRIFEILTAGGGIPVIVAENRIKIQANRESKLNTPKFSM